MSRLQELSDAATSGEWEVDGHAHLSNGCRCLSCHDDPRVWHTTNMIFCDEQPSKPNDFGRDPECCDAAGWSYEDAALAVALVNAWRAGEIVERPGQPGKNEGERA